MVQCVTGPGPRPQPVAGGRRRRASGHCGTLWRRRETEDTYGFNPTQSYCLWPKLSRRSAPIAGGADVAVNTIRCDGIGTGLRGRSRRVREALAWFWVESSAALFVSGRWHEGAKFLATRRGHQSDGSGAFAHNVSRSSSPNRSYVGRRPEWASPSWRISRTRSPRDSRNTCPGSLAADSQQEAPRGTGCG